MIVRKAVIPAAGLGTRFLPASKAVPKNLIPIVDRPIIQYAVEELARAGITNVCIVTSHGTEALADHFTADPELEAALAAAGKDDLLQEMRALQDLADLYYVYQHAPLGLGHAVGVARDHIGDEPFVVLLPDELLDPRRNFLGELIETFEETASSVVAVYEVPGDEIQFYGAVEAADPSEDLMRVRSVIEKPDPRSAPSNLALCGRYVLVPETFEILAKLEPGTSGEVQLADALDVLAGRDRLMALKYRGRRWDVGKKDEYLEAVVALAAEHPELGRTFRLFLEGFRPE